MAKLECRDLKEVPIVTKLKILAPRLRSTLSSTIPMFVVLQGMVSSLITITCTRVKSTTVGAQQGDMVSIVMSFQTRGCRRG